MAKQKRKWKQKQIKISKLKSQHTKNVHCDLINGYSLCALIASNYLVRWTDAAVAMVAAVGAAAAAAVVAAWA